MINNIGYEKSKKWAISNYNKVKGINCPALNNEYIRFNAVGFKHLIRKEKRRSRREQKFRFSLIPYAPRIVADPNVEVTYRVEKNNNGTIIQSWGLEKKCYTRNIRVVIRQKGNGLKHFYSIMEHVPNPSKNPANDEMF